MGDSSKDDTVHRCNIFRHSQLHIWTLWAILRHCNMLATTGPIYRYFAVAVAVAPGELSCNNLRPWQATTHLLEARPDILVIALPYITWKRFGDQCRCDITTGLHQTCNYDALQSVA
jgi:hypothetical protein